MATKRCSICAELLPISSFHRRSHYVLSGVRSACRRCTLARAADRRRERAVTDDTPQHQEKDASTLRKELVRARTRAAVRRGELTPSACEVCALIEVEAHHPDYLAEDAHLRVQWLCRLHHAQVHGTSAWTRQLDLFSPDRPKANRLT